MRQCENCGYEYDETTEETILNQIKSLTERITYHENQGQDDSTIMQSSSMLCMLSVLHQSLNDLWKESTNDQSNQAHAEGPVRD